MNGIGPDVDTMIVRFLVESLGFVWAVCPLCPRRALCNPRIEGPAPRCAFCQVAMVGASSPAGRVN
jgi:hypothetical protein